MTLLSAAYGSSRQLMASRAARIFEASAQSSRLHMPAARNSLLVKVACLLMLAAKHNLVSKVAAGSSAACCRACVGTEAPEVASSLLQQGYYEPNPASDIWAAGLLILELLQAQIPQPHQALHQSEALDADVRAGKLVQESHATVLQVPARPLDQPRPAGVPRAGDAITMAPAMLHALPFTLAPALPSC